VAHWLLKSEASAYSFRQLEQDQRTAWTGVRNFEARNNLRAMAVDDLCLFYHSGDEKAVVGTARVVKAAYADPTAKGEDWSCVDLVPLKGLKRPVTLAEIKATAGLREMQMVRKSRISVTPVTEREYRLVLSLGSAKPA
jgi:predicted RNA-binding protein with PUA-like domain